MSFGSRFRTIVFLVSAGSLGFGCNGSDSKPGDASMGTDAGQDASTDAGQDAAIDGSIGACGPARTVPALTTEPVGSGFAEPLFLASVPGTSDLAVVERLGRIRLVRANTVLATDFLTLDSASLLDASGYTLEQGLLGLAFHPDYASNGRFFIYRTTGDDDPGGRQNLVVEYQRSSVNPDVADPTPVQTIVAGSDTGGSNHNGGMILFGPDGMLYVGIGDGGGSQDSGHGPSGNALNTSTVFGKILRVDVDAASNGFVPADPVFDGTSGNAFVYAFGLRNPFRFSIDTSTSTLFIGDVGQDTYEEIDAIGLSAARGVSFGWALREGLHATNYAHIAAPAGYSSVTQVDPISELAHSGSFIGAMTSVTGGYVYRGGAIPGLQGFYVFGDIGGAVGALRFCEGRAADEQKVDALSTGGTLYSFATDSAGEMYMLHGTGAVRRIIAQ